MHINTERKSLQDYLFSLHPPRVCSELCSSSRAAVEQWRSGCSELISIFWMSVCCLTSRSKSSRLWRVKCKMCVYILVCVSWSSVQNMAGVSVCSGQCTSVCVYCPLSGARLETFQWRQQTMQPVWKRGRGPTRRQTAVVLSSLLPQCKHRALFWTTRLWNETWSLLLDRERRD